MKNNNLYKNHWHTKVSDLTPAHGFNTLNETLKGLTFEHISGSENNQVVSACLLWEDGRIDQIRGGKF